jgi:hypothetical protein
MISPVFYVPSRHPHDRQRGTNCAPLASHTRKVSQHRLERSLFPPGITALFSPQAAFDGSSECSIFMCKSPPAHLLSSRIEVPFSQESAYGLNHLEQIPSGISQKLPLPFLFSPTNRSNPYLIQLHSRKSNGVAYEERRVTDFFQPLM